MALYLVCYDLAQPMNEQIKQVNYWLNFLNSSLDLPPPPVPEDSKWNIMIIGTRSDMQQDPSGMLMCLNANTKSTCNWLS